MRLFCGLLRLWRHLLLIALGELRDLVELLSELSIADSNGKYIDEDFMIGRIRDATELH